MFRTLHCGTLAVKEQYGTTLLLVIVGEHVKAEEDIGREAGRRGIKKPRTNLSYNFAKATLFTAFHWIKPLHRNTEFQGNRNTNRIRTSCLMKSLLYSRSYLCYPWGMKIWLEKSLCELPLQIKPKIVLLKEYKTCESYKAIEHGTSAILHSN